MAVCWKAFTTGFGNYFPRFLGIEARVGTTLGGAAAFYCYINSEFGLSSVAASHPPALATMSAVLSGLNGMVAVSGV